MSAENALHKAGTKILWRAIKRNGRLLGAGTGMISLHQLCEALVPVIIGIIVDRAIETGDAAELVLWVIVLAVLFLVLTLLYRFGARPLMLAIATESHLLRVEAAAKILHPQGIRTDLRTGDLLTVSTTDADNVSYLLDYFPRIAGAVAATVTCAIVLLVINVPLGLAVLIGTPLVLVALQLSAPIITRRVTEQQEAVGKATSTATDLVSGLRPLRGIGAEDAAAKRYQEVSQESLRATLQAARTKGTYVVASATVSALLAVGIAIAGGWLALEGRISIGELITVIGLSQFLIEPSELLAIVPSWIAQARASANRLARVMSMDVLLPAGTAEPGDPPHGLELAGLRFGTLDGLDLSVRPGELVGIVALQPTDGDALVKVLSRQVTSDDYHGDVLLGGMRLDDIELGRARRALLVEPHSTDIFSGTVESNIKASGVSLDDDSGGQESFDHLLRASAAVHVVTAHSDGLEHVISERGANLSGGQRQRVALARALMAHAYTLVLHDPTTAVDSVTEHAIAEGISSLRHGKAENDAPGPFTTLLVTTSPTLLAITDRVVLLDGGRVVNEGTHVELGSCDENYRKAVLR